MQDWWQHLPENLEPIAFSVGFFSLYWYAFFFACGALASFFFGYFLLRKNESTLPENTFFDIFFVVFIGACVGGRIGYVLLYNMDFFLQSPMRIFSPYDFRTGVWTGIAGMSFHGGLIGAVMSLFLFIWYKKSHGYPFSFWNITDFLSLLAPIAIFFGRLGNFFNGELYGRITTMPWGMYFPVEPLEILRHPSTLYEASLEGILLFLILWFFQKRTLFAGELTCLFLCGYAGFRFLGEYFREPDVQLGLFFGELFSLGQILSLLMILFSFVLFFWLRKRNYAILGMLK